MFTKDDFDLLAPMVDGFSLMTYDYPHYSRYVCAYFFPIRSVVKWLRQVTHDPVPPPQKISTFD